ncbi:ABC transporter permease [Dactylosporangium sp. NPDC048998]|uniref:ABC transporter permease n=1 Tax=Dactylosporangium sp. NPDC048998 TaxID=3363976 RepID=UPI00371AC984
MLRTTLAGLRAHKVRLVLTAVAVMIGVGFLAGTLVYGDTARAAFYDDLARAARNVDASAGPDRLPFGDRGSGFAETTRRLDFGDLDAVRGVPGVAHADGRMAERLSMLDGQGRLIADFGRAGWAVSVPGDPALSMFDTSHGRLPQRDGEIAVDATTVQTYGFRLGGTVSVVGPGGHPVALLVLEAVLMSAVGATTGIGLGVLAGAAAAFGLIRQYGHGYPVIPVGQLALYAALATCAAAAAALPPARRATRTALATAMISD